MVAIDSSRARLFVYVYKDGALAALGHDVKLEAKTITFEADPSSVEVAVPVDAIEVLGSVRGGHVVAGELSDKDRRDIKGNMTKDVLHARKHPRVTFSATEVKPVGDGFAIEGTLNLHGSSRKIRCEAKREGDELVAAVKIHLPDYGMKAYKALLGAIKTKPDVLVEARVPVTGE